MTLNSLSSTQASALAQATLAHVTREYPNKLEHVMVGADRVLSPRALHPVFFGSFDWHSCVHGWWTMFTLIRLHPALPEENDILHLAGEIFTPDAIAGELAYLARPENAGFKRTYGWAWLLMLAAELHRHQQPCMRNLADTLRPLTETFVRRFETFLPISSYPGRVGTHTNTAFALRLAIEYGRILGDADFELLCRSKALSWYGGDRACQVWEPSQDDFLSPTLVEIELMRYALPADEFAGWLERFLPEAGSLPAVLLTPPVVADRTDGKIAHLDGLSLSRAWCLNALAGALPAQDSRRGQALAAAERHVADALPHIADDYAGQHWLASFVVLALVPDREKSA